MRINGLSQSAYPLDRAARPGSAPVPYRDSQRTVERPREIDVSPASEHFQQRTGRAQQSTSESVALEHYRPIRYSEAQAERPLPSRVAQALASYASTASFISSDPAAAEVLGLDLYA
ncbi:hypothetical protein YO5_07873 [Stutzerimonas stutzeri TS44]|nr:hypothetical protein YO5_07873 [Stutzerimonas stutzeri TS44]